MVVVLILLVEPKGLVVIEDRGEKCWGKVEGAEELIKKGAGRGCRSRLGFVNGVEGGDDFGIIMLSKEQI